MQRSFRLACASSIAFGLALGSITTALGGRAPEAPAESAHPPSDTRPLPPLWCRPPGRGSTQQAGAALVCGGKLDLNRASQGELQLLPGVGPTLAQRITDHRVREGPFMRHRELTRVRGLGPVMVAKLARVATVKGSPTRESQRSNTKPIRNAPNK